VAVTTNLVWIGGLGGRMGGVSVSVMQHDLPLLQLPECLQMCFFALLAIQLECTVMIPSIPPSIA
jgi:hypothetical protein